MNISNRDPLAQIVVPDTVCGFANGPYRLQYNPAEAHTYRNAYKKHDDQQSHADFKIDPHLRLDRLKRCPHSYIKAMKNELRDAQFTDTRYACIVDVLARYVGNNLPVEIARIKEIVRVPIMKIDIKENRRVLGRLPNALVDLLGRHAVIFVTEVTPDLLELGLVKKIKAVN